MKLYDNLLEIEFYIRLQGIFMEKIECKIYDKNNPQKDNLGNNRILFWMIIPNYIQIDIDAFLA